MKKLTKRILTASLALAMSLSLAACGGGGTPTTSTPPATGTPAGGAPESSTPSGGGNEAVNLRLSIADAAGSIFDQGAQAFKEKVEEISGGNITVTVYPSGQLGTLAEVTQGIQMGTIDVAAISSSVLGNFCPDIAVFDLPFLINDYEHAYRALDGSVGEKLAASLDENDLHVIGWWVMGFRNVTASKAIGSVADLAGLKSRTQSSDIQMDIFSALGCSPTAISFSELYTALQQHTVDAQENPYVNIRDNNYYDVNNYLVETEHVFQVAGFLMSPAMYDSLTDEQKAWVDEAAAYATDVERKATETDNETAKEELINEHGMTFVALDKAELKAATQSVYDKYAQYADMVTEIDSFANA